LRLVINEILWIGRNPGNVVVIASWWGEYDNAQFRLDFIIFIVKTTYFTIN